MKPQVATELVDIACRDFELFHDPAGEPFAATLSLPRETFRIERRARRFGGALSRSYYKERHGAPSDSALSAALRTLGEIALADGGEHDVFIRVGEHAGLTYYDLADGRRRAVEIGPQGYRVVDDPPVLFLRPKGLMSQVEPAAGGSLDDLRELLNVADDDGFRLLVGFLLSAIQSRGPYPLLSITGVQGSAKSTAAWIIRMLADPNEAPLRAPPRDLWDLAVATRGSWVIAIDNMSRIPPELSDALCRLSTGGAFANRELYTTAEEFTFEARRPVVLTSIPDVVTSSDLADRTLGVILEPIPDHSRRTEAEVRAAFAEAAPRLLGGMFMAMSGAMASVTSGQPHELPRMAELATVMARAEPALRWQPGSFASALSANRTQAAASSVEASTVGRYLLALAEQGGFRGTASDLLAQLENQAGEDARRDRYLPKNARSLSSTLRRMLPDLVRLGVPMAFSREGHDGARTITIGSVSSDSAPRPVTLPSGSRDVPAPRVAEAVSAMEHVGFDLFWSPGRMAATALQKSGGNAFVAARALNMLGAPARAGGTWTAVKVEAACRGEGSS